MSEVGHLPAGLSHLQFARFDLYRVNPPLVDLVAAIPVLLAHPGTNWRHYSLDPTIRSETEVGIDFVNANGPRVFFLYTLGRWACIPFSVLGAWVCCRWATELYGSVPGLLAAALWCYCPNILGHAALIMPDVPAAALAVSATYTFWRWLKLSTWAGALQAGLALGLAELTKSTLLVLVPLWPVLWLLYRLPRRRGGAANEWPRQMLMLLAMLVLAVNVLNLGYGFEGSGERLGNYRFRSATLTGFDDPRNVPDAGANRFEDSWLAAVRVPLPRNYIQGLDTQKVDFERGMTCYLHGEWKERGWWYFYLYAFAVKVPIGTLLIVLLASGASLFSQRYRAEWQNEIVVLLPLVSLLALVSSQTGFSIHFRYAVPVLPFVFVWASKVGLSFTYRNSYLASATTIGILAGATSSLWVFPHSLSYFNEFVGGPRHGHEHLLFSNISWGQDLLDLKRWCDRHPEARPLYLATIGFVDPRWAGIEFSLPPANVPSSDDSPTTDPVTLAEGWYAVDVNHLHGTWLFAPVGDGTFSSLGSRSIDVTTFRNLRPVALIGYSTYIYHVPAGLENNP